MKRKFVLTLNIFITAVCMIFSLAACTGSVKLDHVHSLSFVSATSQSCTSDGHKAYYICDDCGKWFEDDEGEIEITDEDSIVIPKGHNLTFIEAKKATCKEGGNTAYYICNNCGNFFEDEDGKTQISDKKSVVLASSHNYVEKVCSNCGYHEPTEGLKYTDKGDYCEVSGIGTATETDIYIADSYNGKPVTAIAMYAFWNTDITSVTIPDSVTSIGGDAFQDCKDLKRVNLPDGLTTINDGAFEGCASLESIDIPDKVTYIGTWSFSECVSLTEITIPDYVQTLEGYAFENCENLVRITIGSGVKTIDEFAFYGCFNLKDLTFKGTRQQWEEIDKRTFGPWSWNNYLGDYNVHCTDESFIEGHRLTYISAKAATCVEDGNTSYYSCSNCDKWYRSYNATGEITDKSSVVIPKGHKLTLVKATKSTCKIQGNTEYYSCGVCGKFYTELNGENEITDKKSVIVNRLPHDYADKICTACGIHEPTEGLEYYDNGDDCYVSGIGTATDTEIYIADFYNDKPVTSIHGWAFSRCISIESVTIPDSVTYINEYAFINCTSLKKVVIPDSVTYIDDWVFDNCKSLESITIPDSVTYIGGYLFYDCVSLKSVTLSGSIYDLDSTVFRNCSSLSDIFFNGTKARWDALRRPDGWDNDIGEYTVHCKDASFTAGHSLTFIKAKAATCTEDGHEDYYTCAYCDKWFKDSEAKTEISNKDTVILTKFGHNITYFEKKEATCLEKGHTAYYSCGNCDKWFEDGDGNIEISNKTTVVIKKLSHIYENGVCTQCGTEKQEPTAGLEYTDKGEYCELKSIGDATYGDIVIADEIDGKPVTSIAANAFAWSAIPTSIFIPDSVTQIGDGAFQGCSNVTSIFISDNLTSIGNNVFYQLGITSVEIPESVTSIGEKAFSGCDKLTSIIIPDNVTSIGKAAFSWCRRLTSVNIGRGVTSIGAYAFELCEKLESIVIPENVVSLGNNVFEKCTILKRVTLSKNITSFGRDILNECTLLTDIYFDGTEDEWYEMRRDLGSIRRSYIIHCTDGDLEVRYVKM